VTDFDDEFPEVRLARDAIVDLPAPSRSETAELERPTFDLDHEPDLDDSDPGESDDAQDDGHDGQAGHASAGGSDEEEAAEPEHEPDLGYLLEDWDFTFVAPDPDHPPLLEAARLAYAILKRVKVVAWTDLPEDTWRLFEQYDILLSEQQIALLDEYDELLGYQRQSVAKRGDNPGIPGVKLAVCAECGVANIPSWKLVVSGSGGHCAMNAAHTKALLVTSAVPTTAAAIKKQANVAAKAAAKEAEEAAAKAAADGVDDAQPASDAEPVQEQAELALDG
jgi:hypothetical protein